METKFNNWAASVIMILMLCSLDTPKAYGQQHLLIQEPISAGDLTLYRHLKNANEYYYVLNQIRLATNEDGTPQFGFTKYVRNVTDDKSEANVTESNHAGGIITATLSLEVTDEQKREAAQDLRRIDPRGIIKGPVSYKSGTVQLIRRTNRDGVEKKPSEEEVIATKQAPLLEGNKAGFSIDLDKEESDKLWATFNTPNPDVLFAFHMDIEGYSSPIEASIEADLEKIYNHHLFKAAAVYSVHSAEVEVALKELRDTKAIKIKQIGKNDNMERVVQQFTKMVMDRLFEKDHNTSTKNSAKAASGIAENVKRTLPNRDRRQRPRPQGPPPPKGRRTTPDRSGSSNDKPGPGKSHETDDLLARANEARTGARDKVDTENKRLEEQHKEALKGAEKTAKTARKDSVDAQKGLRLAQNDAAKAEKDTKTLKEAMQKAKQELEKKEQERKALETNISKVETQAAPFQEIVKTKKEAIAKHKGEIAKLSKSAHDQRKDLQSKIAANSKDLAKAEQQLFGLKLKELRNQKSNLAKEIKSLNGEIKTGTDAISVANKSIDSNKSKVTEAAMDASNKAALAKKADQALSEASEKEIEKEEKPEFTAALSYRLKREKETGTWSLDFNQNLAITQTISFDEGIGKINCRLCFQEVNLDNAMYKQREVHAQLDNGNFQDFTDYINSVTVSLRKKHQNGETTIKEILVDKQRFNQDKNDFVMQYGWKGDEDQDRWEEYEYKTHWSFHGGYTVESEWIKAGDGKIDLAPPFEKKRIELTAHEESMQAQNIRAIEVKMYSPMGNTEQVQQVQIKAGDVLSIFTDLILARGSFDFEYQTTWFVNGKDPISSDRIPYSNKTIYLYGLPSTEQ